MDHLSFSNMPSAEERKTGLLNYANTLIHNTNATELNKIIDKIVSETDDYSLTGYMVFGKQIEYDKLRSQIN